MPLDVLLPLKQMVSDALAKRERVCFINNEWKTERIKKVSFSIVTRCVVKAEMLILAAPRYQFVEPPICKPIADDYLVQGQVDSGWSLVFLSLRGQNT